MIQCIEAYTGITSKFRDGRVLSARGAVSGAGERKLLALAM
jgi:hypothetical protein